MLKKFIQKVTSIIAIEKPSFRSVAITLSKLVFAGLCTVAIFCIYLDAKVRQKFEGQRWHVPVQVYGQIQNLALGQQIDLAALSQSLKLNGYAEVSFVTAVGQFSYSKDNLVVFQRAIDFIDAANIPQQLNIEVKDNIIVALNINERPVATLQLEPQLIARLVPDNKEDRVLVALEDLPNELIDTLILIEDRDFYSHHGVSPIGILRALYTNIRAGRTVQGGSTLTQQLAKNMFLSRERTLTRKINEALMSLILEARYSKDQILEAYINEVYLGQHYANGVYGFGLAAQFYFGKTIENLNHAQMALLIAQIKGPSYYDPWRNPKRALNRRDLVLRLMFEQEFLTLDEFEFAAESDLLIRANRRMATKAYPGYLQLVNSELNQLLTSVDKQSGIKVFTGFSHRSQQLLEQSIKQKLPQLEKQFQQEKLEAAMIVTDIDSGEIRALVGGRDSAYAGFNRALNAKRHIGSLIKPVIFGAALEDYQNYNLASIIDDEPITLKNTSGKKWQPKNYDGKYRGQVMLNEALVHSLNIPTINLGMSLGLENIGTTLNKLGYDSSLTMRPSFLLGAINMSPLEVNQLYLTIAHRGSYQKQHAITHVLSAENETLWQHVPEKEPRMSVTSNYLLNHALMDVTKTGTARALTWRLKNTVTAGKTGTSNDLRDSWYVGFDDKHLVTTWVGKDNNQPTKLTGSSGALPLFAQYMKKQGVVNKVDVKPNGIKTVLFEQKTGNAVGEACADTVAYPAIAAGIELTTQCLKEKVDKRSWFERLFGS